MPEDHAIGDTLDANDSGSYRLRKMRAGLLDPLELLIKLIKLRKKQKALLRRRRPISGSIGATPIVLVLWRHEERSPLRGSITSSPEKRGPNFRDSTHG
jgi:hypothetical protein